jgi:glycosyltransferase involved in cell wall biosynthesis
MPAPPVTAVKAKRRKRLLFVAHSGYAGGAEYCLDTLLRHLDLGKYEVTALFPWDGPMVASARGLGIKVEVLPVTWWMCFGASPWHVKRLLFGALPTVGRLASYIRKHRIDLVYSNSAVIFEAALAARLAGVPHIWHVHEVLDRGYVKNPVLPLPLITRLIRGLSAKVLFESHASRRAYAAGRPAPEAEVVYNSVRFPAAAPAAGGERAAFGLPEKGLVVGFVGQFIDRKNPLALIRAIPLLEDRARLQFLFVGDGPLRQEMAEQVRALGLEDCCRIVGFQEDVGAVMRAIDLLVLPSRQESFGLVLVEAGLFGKPAVATRVEGPSEIIADGETGLLVRDDDPADLAEALQRLAADDGLRRRMGEAAARRARALFSAEQNTRQIEQLIDQVLR